MWGLLKMHAFLKSITIPDLIKFSLIYDIAFHFQADSELLRLRHGAATCGNVEFSLIKSYSLLLRLARPIG